MSCLPCTSARIDEVAQKFIALALEPLSMVCDKFDLELRASGLIWLPVVIIVLSGLFCYVSAGHLATQAQPAHDRPVLSKRDRLRTLPPPICSRRYTNNVSTCSMQSSLPSTRFRRRVRPAFSRKSGLSTLSNAVMPG